LEITGVDGIISIDYIDQTVKLYGKNARKVNVEHKEPLREELSSFLSAIDRDEEPKITGADGIHALKVVLAAMKSAKSKIPINMNEC
jgi:UDP-N-acetylglucosamine 3-dehydrogenase